MVVSRYSFSFLLHCIKFTGLIFQLKGNFISDSEECEVRLNQKWHVTVLTSNWKFRGSRNHVQFIHHCIPSGWHIVLTKNTELKLISFKCFWNPGSTLSADFNSSPDYFWPLLKSSSFDQFPLLQSLAAVTFPSFLQLSHIPLCLKTIFSIKFVILKPFKIFPQPILLSSYTTYAFDYAVLFISNAFGLYYFLIPECPTLFLPNVMSSGRLLASPHQIYYSLFWKYNIMINSELRNQTSGLQTLISPPPSAQ